jgi:hypothetical protein
MRVRIVAMPASAANFHRRCGLLVAPVIDHDGNF